MLDNFVPPYSATAVEKLEQAGVIVVGKLNMDEFGMGSTSETSYYGAVKNPHDENRVSGGSSGGSAAAVAAKESIISLGTDTGGSIRQPASYCGAVGFKPTYGTVSRYGLLAYASSLDQIGPIGRDAADCAAMYEIITGRDPQDSTSLDLPPIAEPTRPLKIALPSECFGDGVDDAVKKHVLSAAETFKQMGATVEYINLPFNDYVIPTYYIIATAEASSNLSRYDGVKYGFRAEHAADLSQLYNTTRSEGFGTEVIKRILLGTFVLSSGYYDAYYKKALQVKAIICKHFNEIFREYDAVITPVAPTTAPRLGESLSDPLKMYLSDIFTVTANLAGLPAISVPCGSENGLPVGMQIIGNSLSDKLVLSLAASYERGKTP
jgi:aspartyl-tRNA(Asn)/glutamyl-tRNA(Gln) amidotransferase subunit A